MAKGRKTGGKVKGSHNKSTLEGQQHVERILAKLKEEKNLTIEDISVALLTSGVPAIIQRELASIREFNYSKPKQQTEISTEDGQPLLVLSNASSPRT